MILCDTNVLVALVDNQDALYPLAGEALVRLSRKKIYVTEPVLTEAIHLLPVAAHRSRLCKYLLQVPILPVQQADPERTFRQVFEWLDRYAEHSPDFADGHLAVLSGNDPRFRVWTYDREFQTIWRRLDGTRIPVVGI